MLAKESAAFCNEWKQPRVVTSPRTWGGREHHVDYPRGTKLGKNPALHMTQVILR
jgi:hypothetical protein